MTHDTDYTDEDLQWENVGTTNEWAKNSGRLVLIGARRIGVYNFDGEWYAIKDICPHAGVSLVSGCEKEDSITEKEAVCPAHAWRFNLESGQCISEFAPDCKVANYPVRIEGDQVQVGI